MFVYPYNTATSSTSRIELPATTVINVDNVQVLDAPYPGGIAVTAASIGDTVYIRSQVSDPFGTFDITSASYTITDSTPTSQGSGSLAVVFDNGADVLTFESAYLVPVAPVGSWTASVTAIEGTEGTVTHTGLTSFTVIDTNIVLQKNRDDN